MQTVISWTIKNINVIPIHRFHPCKGQTLWSGPTDLFLVVKAAHFQSASRQVRRFSIVCGPVCNLPNKTRNSFFTRDQNWRRCFRPPKFIFIFHQVSFFRAKSVHFSAGPTGPHHRKSGATWQFCGVPSFQAFKNKNFLGSCGTPGSWKCWTSSARNNE